MAASKLHPLVDVFDGAEATLVLANRVEQKRDQQPVDDEAGAVGGGAELSELARYAAMPPAQMATVRTTMRALFIRFTFHKTPRR